MWWGYSPALDLIEEYLLIGDISDHGPLNILILGGSDGRHIIKTISEIYRYGKQDIEIHFFVIETSLELIARQMLLLTLSLEPPHILGLMEKATLFLEIYGNTIIRPNAYNYIINKSYQLIHMVTDLEYMKKRLPILSIEYLKYKDRDVLESIFKFWYKCKDKYLNIENLWDNRLRRSLQSRYDSKMGVFDWDYHMRLCKIGRESISYAEYKKWRLKGIAYSWMDRVVSKPNYTLITGIQKANGDIVSAGYGGDIENGPFAAYGLQKNDQVVQNPRKSTRLSQMNVMSILHNMLNTNQSIQFPDEREFEGAVLVDDCLENLTAQKVTDDEAADKNTDSKLTAKEDYAAVSVGMAKVIYLPITYFSEMHTKERFKNFFNVILFSHNKIDCFNSNIMETSKNKSVVLVETLNFVLPPKKDCNTLFEEKIDEFAKECNCKPVHSIGIMDNLFKRFEFCR